MNEALVERVAVYETSGLELRTRNAVVLTLIPIVQLIF